MKTKTLLAFASLLLLAACGGKHRNHAADAPQVPDMHTAETALDYTGTYSGVIPAADGPGIAVRLTLSGDGRYTLDENYIDRDTDFHTEGRYTVRENTLTLGSKEGKTYYKVEENRLRMLTQEQQPITGQLADHYVLTKTKSE